LVPLSGLCGSYSLLNRPDGCDWQETVEEMNEVDGQQKKGTPKHAQDTFATDGSGEL
jgi:hypothetical protein